MLSGVKASFRPPRAAAGLISFLALAAAACGPSEARDPGDVLGNWRQHNGVDGRTGSSAETPAAGAAQIATREECQAASERIETLALELAVAEEGDAEKRKQLENRAQKELQSDAFKQRVEDQTDGCLGRETTSAEARCIAKIRNQQDLDRCSAR